MLGITRVTARAERRSATALADIKADYARLGYALVGGLFHGDEVQSWRHECDRLWALPSVQAACEPRVDLRDTLDGRRVPERLDPVIDASPLFAALAHDPRVLNVASALLGEPPLLFKDKLIAKTAGTVGYRTHQDYAYIAFLGFPGHKQLAVAIALDAADEHNGAIEIFGGRHARLLPPASDDRFLVDESTLDLADATMACVEPGDMLVLNSLCPHRSAPNRTSEPRRLLFFTYNAASAGDHYETYYRLGKP